MTIKTKMYWAARINFTTLDVYIRQKKLFPSFYVQYSKTPNPNNGDIYGETESEVLENINTLLIAHAEKMKQLVGLFAGDTIPVLKLENGRNAQLARHDLVLTKAHARKRA